MSLPHTSSFILNHRVFKPNNNENERQVQSKVIPIFCVKLSASNGISCSINSSVTAPFYLPAMMFARNYVFISLTGSLKPGLH